MSNEFEPGDSIIYPHYGAGTIVEEKTIQRNGEENDYYVIDILLKQQKVMLPKNEQEEVGVRPPTDRSDFLEMLENVSDEVLELYDEEEGEHPDKIHRKSLQSMLDDVRQGDLETMMEGLKKLHTRFLDQELNVTEKRFYDTAQQFIVGELMAIEDISKQEAYSRLDEYLPDELPETENDDEDEENDEDED
ncbi:MAG: CarD family transcriptional regulator [bacterium]